VADHATECVLVIPTRLLWERAPRFHGFTPDITPFADVLFDPDSLLYLPRAVAEQDPTHKQLIPYVVLRWRDQVFHYTRGKSGTEARLRALRSIGVGGHICQEDAGNAGAYRTGMLRELAEEVVIGTTFTEHMIGLINDDRTPVGEVHLGIVHLLELEAPEVRRAEEALDACGLAEVSRLRAEVEQFETWSQFLLEGGLLSPPSTQKTS
jgi:predicted NUDIX family phosphoesterase